MNDSQKLDHIMRQLDCLPAMEEKLSTIESETTAIKQEVSEVRNQINNLSAALDAAVSRIASLESSTSTTDQNIETLKTDLDKMRCEMERLQQQALANDFVIHGLPPITSNLVPSALENLGRQLDVSLSVNDFSRQPFAIMNRAKTSSSIIGTFSSNATKQKVFKAFRERKPVVVEDVVQVDDNSTLRGKEIRIRNSLTPANRHILAEGNRLKGNLFAYCWDINGTVHLKKDENSQRIAIRSISHLNEVINNARNQQS